MKLDKRIEILSERLKENNIIVDCYYPSTGWLYILNSYFMIGYIDNKYELCGASIDKLRDIKYEFVKEEDLIKQIKVIRDVIRNNNSIKDIKRRLNK